MEIQEKEDAAIMMSPAAGTRKERSRSPRSCKTSKPKRPPPITPKRFSKFFTPRSSGSQTSRSSATRAGRQLRDITTSAINRRSLSRSFPKINMSITADQLENTQAYAPKSPELTPMKRKHVPSPSSSPPPHSSPSKRPRVRQRVHFDDIPSSPPVLTSIPEVDYQSPEGRNDRSPSPEVSFCAPIRRLRNTGINGRIIERSFGGYDVLGRGRRRDPCLSAKHKLSDFYSREEDIQAFRPSNIPFCTKGCNTNSLVGIGTEYGEIQLVDTQDDTSFKQSIIIIKPHDNAIIDMEFSSDDSILATASGDQTARLIDMRTQQTKAVLSNHISSVKQVRFQPGDENVIATCGRDGIVNLWDLRCSHDTRMVMDMTYPRNGTLVQANQMRTQHAANYYSDPLIPIKKAHMDRQALTVMNNNGSRDGPNRLGDVSVTALTFLSAQRSHLLLTASEASSSVKVWDIRSRYSRRSTALPVPISFTKIPDFHQKHRDFGITSLVLSGNQSRLYALSRDSTLYAYSTNHLILGEAPELESHRDHKPRIASDSREGLGPLYGFRHPNLRVTSFYVKAALRPAQNDKPELIAVGSSDRNPVLFSTDESEFPRVSKPVMDDSADSVPSTPRLRSGVSLSFRSAAALKDSVPIHALGTVLTHGHSKEVTGLTWTRGGNLVTVSDDFTARCWRENKEKARKLRIGGDGEGGARHRCGWAEVSDGFDDES